MKTILKTISCLALLATGYAKAQIIAFASARYGLIAGTTYSHIVHAHNPSSGKIGTFGGFLAEIPVGASDQLYLQPQVEYYQAGEKGDAGTKYGNNYISIPVYFKAFYSYWESEVFAQFGPRFSFLLNQNVENPAKAIYKPDEFGKTAFFDLALSGGLGYSHKRKVEIMIRFDYGLLNTLPSLKGKESYDTSSFLSKRQLVFSTGISYILD